MNFKKEDLAEVLELIGQADEFKPVVREVIKLIGEFGGELKPLLDGMDDYFINGRIRAIRKYTAEGFTQDDAISMTLSDREQIRRLAEQSSKNAKK